MPEPLIDPKIRIKRLRYRSWHRGCKETDVILGHFADGQLENLDSKMLDIYELLLEEADADIWDWLTDKSAPSSADYLPLLALLKTYGLPTE
jgi:antitoxin CptB